MLQRNDDDGRQLQPVGPFGPVILLNNYNVITVVIDHDNLFYIEKCYFLTTVHLKTQLKFITAS